MIKILTAFLSIILISAITGCSPTSPIQTSLITDDRPVIMFKFEDQEPKEPVNIYIDNLYMGDALKFKEGELGLKIISGTHALKVEHKNTIILEKKLFVGKGATKTININLQ